MEAYTSTLGLLTHSHTYLLTHSLICPHNALVSHLKLKNGPEYKCSLKYEKMQFWNLFEIIKWCKYRQFYKTLPKFSAFINRISVRFYETDSS